MGTIVEQLLKVDSKVCPLENIKGELLNIYITNKMAVLVTKKGINFPRGIHHHDDYEFFIPHSHNIPVTVEKRNMTANKHQLFPFNSGQEHGASDDLFEVYFMGLHVDKNFLQEIARLVYRKKEVVFENETYLLGNELQNFLHLFVEECRNKPAGHTLILESLCIQIAVILLRQVKNNLQSLPTRRSYSENENIHRAIEWLREFYNKDYSLEQLAQLANLSPYHFIRVFKAHTGKTPYDYLLEVKIEKAQQMLRQKKFSIIEVCLACGFNNSSHFTAVFKKKVGVSPSEYRRQIST